MKTTDDRDENWKPTEAWYAETTGAHRATGGRACALRLVGKQCLDLRVDRHGELRHATCPGCTGLGFSCPYDHPSMWIKNGKPYSLVLQPYGLDYEGMQSIVALCEQHGLVAHVDARSWHCPGGTVLIEIKKPSEHEKEL